MTEKERQTKLKKLRKKLAVLYEDIAELANSSRAVQANVRQSVDIVEGEIYKYENMEIDLKGIEVLLRGVDGLEKKLTVVKNNADPFNGIISENSAVGKKLRKIRVGEKINIGMVEYEVLETKKVALG